MSFRSFLFCVGLSLALLTGCSHLGNLLIPDQRERSAYLDGPRIDLQADSVANYRSNQEQVVASLVKVAGLSAARTTGGDYSADVVARARAFNELVGFDST